jgi:hypothetical protein
MKSTDIDKDGTLDVVESKKAIKLAKYYLGEEFELEIYNERIITPSNNLIS